ncbi:MAG: hypothetical protein IJD95_01355 [Clostridia bacterium]|nr:hypothetical protein [Clostridia bacterium]MBR2327785.1 hypothetical protein [Clostridia bacterium]
MDKKVFVAAAIGAVVGAAAALGAVAVVSKMRTGKYCLCVPENTDYDDCNFRIEDDDVCDCGCDCGCEEHAEENCCE